MQGRRMIQQVILFSLLLILNFSCAQKDDFPAMTPVVITAVTPGSVLPGDTIVIDGSGFKNKENTVVIFPDTSLGRIIEASASRLKVVVPRKQNISGVLRVRTGVNNYATAPAEFTILSYPAPVVNSISLTQGPVGTAVMAEGDFLSEVLEVSGRAADIVKTKVWVGGVEAKIDSLSFTKVWFKIPDGVVNGNAQISIVRDGKKSAPFDFLVDKYFLFKDDFEQGDLQSRQWNVLAGAWNISSSDTAKFLESATGTNISIVNTFLKTQTDANNDFSLSGRVYVKGIIANAWAGIVFHAQDDKNYYALRISGTGTLQLVRIINGTASLIVQNTSQTARLQGNDFYRLEVTGLAPYLFSVRVLNKDEEEIINLPSVSDAQTKFNGGFAGFYSTSGTGGRFDDFRIKSSRANNE